MFVSTDKFAPWLGAVVFDDGEETGYYYEKWPDRWLPRNYFGWSLQHAQEACQRNNWVEVDPDLLVDEGL